MMVYRGRVTNGVIALKRNVQLPEGTNVLVEPVNHAANGGRRAKRRRSVAQRLAAVIGKAQGLPTDSAENIDHYLYGHSKR